MLYCHCKSVIEMQYGYWQCEIDGGVSVKPVLRMPTRRHLLTKSKTDSMIQCSEVILRSITCSAEASHAYYNSTTDHPKWVGTQTVRYRKNDSEGDATKRFVEWIDYLSSSWIGKKANGLRLTMKVDAADDGRQIGACHSEVCEALYSIGGGRPKARLISSAHDASCSDECVGSLQVRQSFGKGTVST
jgi:hypothetical protein